MARKNDHMIRIQDEPYQQLQTLPILPPNSSTSKIIQKTIEVTKIILTQRIGNEDLTETALRLIKNAKTQPKTHPVPSPV